MEKDSPDVFLSHAGPETDLAHALAEELRSRGVRAWTDAERMDADRADAHRTEGPPMQRRSLRFSFSPPPCAT